MSQSLFNLKSFSRSINNIAMMRRYIAIAKASQRGYTIGSSREKPWWTFDSDSGYYRPETGANTSQREVKMMRGKELWWMPDSHTGYYRPDSFARELDSVDLRSLHCNENKETL